MWVHFCNPILSQIESEIFSLLFKAVWEIIGGLFLIEKMYENKMYLLRKSHFLSALLQQES